MTKWARTEEEKIERRRLQREAQNASARRWHADNKDYAKRNYRNNYVRLMLTRAKHRAAKQGLPFELEVGDIQIPTHCPVLGIELKINQGRQGVGNSSPSLDKMHPALGYVRGNVRVISGRANMIKRDGTAEELRKIANWMDENQF